MNKEFNMACLHVNSCKEDSISTGVRLCKYLSEYLRIPFIHNKISAITYMDNYDILFIRYGILLYCDFREELFKIYKNAKRIIALEEDYTIGVDYRLTKLNPSLEIWTNMPWRLKEHKGRFVNWNRLTWEHGLKHKDPLLLGLGYYGSYRPDREIYFKKYFKDASYKIYISTFPRNSLKFRDLNHNIKVFEPFRSRNLISAFQNVLYIEDTFTHSHYNCPANRFYECLCRGVPLLFDKSCERTFKKAGYIIDPFIVNNQTDVHNKIFCSEQIRALQKEQWYKNYYLELCKDLDKIISKSIGEKYVQGAPYPKV